jgi:NADP-dependent 3-hydroxy acid dehydrogenase YdfG
MIDKEVAIVTGASKGIGRAIAIKLAEEGKFVCAFGRNKTDLQELESQNKNIKSFSGDLTDKTFIEKSVDDILNEFGKVDHLINNAGLAVFKKFVDTSIEEFESQININLFAVFNFTKALVNHFIERKSGTIINISSIAGKNGFVYGTTYAASKHALMGFTKSLFLELREFDIRVASVCPGSVETEMIINSPVQPKNLDKVLKANDVAEVVSTIIKMPSRALISEIEIRPNNPK